MSFTTLLIANRGEIARRIMRSAHEMGISCVAVYVDADADAAHVRDADFALRLDTSYLDVAAVLDAASKAKADAIHPGYGFLSENADFAEKVGAAGITWVGPSPEAISQMGDKIAAKALAEKAQVPTLPGSLDPCDAAALGYPLIVKAAAGGGGKGMRVVLSADALEESVAAAKREALSGFGDDRVFLERYVARARHIEIQILGDAQGNIVHLGERECSIQRRHQKIIEESPSPRVDAELRKAMTEAALRLARELSYQSAGTVEFLLDDESGEFFFLEVNARLQVEHPVTEMITGIDIVKTQIRVAAGEELGFSQEDVVWRGHAIECRINAEDPDNNFAPSPGTVETLRIPGGPGIRDDSCLFEGYEVPIHYDPIVGKLIAWGTDRRAAIRRLQRALEEYKVRGIATTIPLFQRVLADPDFINADFDTGYLDRFLNGAPEPAGSSDDDSDPIAEAARLAAAVHVFLSEEERAYRPPSTVGSPWKLAGRAARLDHEL